MQRLRWVLCVFGRTERGQISAAGDRTVPDMQERSSVETRLGELKGLCDGAVEIRSSVRKRKMEAADGLEPSKTSFADWRLDHFGIAAQKTLCKPSATCTQALYPKLYPNCPHIAYLRLPFLTY